MISNFCQGQAIRNVYIPKYCIKEQTHPRSWAIHKKSGRDGKGNCKLIAIQALPYEGWLQKWFTMGIFWLNIFHTSRANATISLRVLCTGLAIDYNKNCKVAFSTYVQVHEKSDNSLSPRTSAAIALWPTGNEQGGHYFPSLPSGEKVNRYTWMELPMPNKVIKQVHRLARTAEKYEGITTHGYNLRKCSTNHTEIMSMTQTGQE